MDNIPFTPPAKKIKSDYMWRDIERRAKFYGFEAKVPAPYPLKEFDLANQIAILGMNEGWGVKYVFKTYQRWFQQGKEPATEPNLTEIFKELNLKYKSSLIIFFANVGDEWLEIVINLISEEFSKTTNLSKSLP